MHILLVMQTLLKGIVHSDVVQTLYECLSSIEHKQIYFEECR